MNKKKKFTAPQAIYLVLLTWAVIFSLLSSYDIMPMGNFIYHRLQAAGNGWRIGAILFSIFYFIVLWELSLDKSKAGRAVNMVLLTLFILVFCFSIGFHFKY